MQGFILHIQPVRDEDVIVRVLTSQRCVWAYRFYGVRHSVIGLGHKIDAVFENESGRTRLRHVLHLGRRWEHDFNKKYLWQDFIRLLSRHLRDINEIEDFYFTWLDSLYERCEKGNPKRILLEGYLDLLAHEGRYDEKLTCFACHRPIISDLTLSRSFLASHKQCKHNTPFNYDLFIYYYLHQTTIGLEDQDVDTLWKILLSGL